MSRPSTSTASDVSASGATIRYGQCWEDADVLRQALDIGPGDRVLSIGSAGDNALALLLDDPTEVAVVDLNPAQIACLALRVAAFKSLDYDGLLELVGARASTRRAELYRQCRPALNPDAAAFWDAHPTAIEIGIGEAGTFEGFFRTFRRRILPLAHPRRRVQRLLTSGGDIDTRRDWYDREWDTLRWRMLFAVATSRAVLGRARYPTAFSQVQGSVAQRLRSRVRQSVTATDPAANPYLAAILTEPPRRALPPYLQPDAFETIRDRIDRISWRLGTLEATLSEPGPPFTQFNLSDVFEYLDPAQADALFRQIADSAAPGARLAYWNVLADRQPSAALRPRLARLGELADRLHARDRAPFYGAFHVDEVMA